MRLTMDNHSSSMAALTGFVLVIINHFTGMFNTAFLFEYFSSENARAFVLGAIGAFGGLMARYIWLLFIKSVKWLLFTSKKKPSARK
jgi:hypothetical protein